MEKRISYKEFKNMCSDCFNNNRFSFLIRFLFKFYIIEEAHEYRVVKVTSNNTFKVFLFLPYVLFVFIDYLWKGGIKEFIEDFPTLFGKDEGLTLRIKKSPSHFIKNML